MGAASTHKPYHEFVLRHWCQKYCIGSVAIEVALYTCTVLHPERKKIHERDGQRVSGRVNGQRAECGACGRATVRPILASLCARASEHMRGEEREHERVRGQVKCSRHERASEILRDGRATERGRSRRRADERDGERARFDERAS